MGTVSVEYSLERSGNEVTKIHFHYPGKSKTRERRMKWHTILGGEDLSREGIVKLVAEAEGDNHRLRPSQQNALQAELMNLIHNDGKREKICYGDCT
jgi:hypothetical protein